MDALQSSRSGVDIADNLEIVASLRKDARQITQTKAEADNAHTHSDDVPCLIRPPASWWAGAVM